MYCVVPKDIDEFGVIHRRIFRSIVNDAYYRLLCDEIGVEHKYPDFSMTNIDGDVIEYICGSLILYICDAKYSLESWMYNIE
jgi:hypothetical protein